MKKNNKQSKELDVEKLVKSTKGTIIGTTVTAAYGSAVTILCGALTAYGVSNATEDQTKKVIGVIGGTTTAFALGLTVATISRMNGCIENHDDVVKLSILKKFLDAGGDEERDELLGNMIGEMHTKTVGEMEE